MTDLEYGFLEATIGLRFVDRDGRKILQQAWKNENSKIEWRDIPVEKETEECK